MFTSKLNQYSLMPSLTVEFKVENLTVSWHDELKQLTHSVSNEGKFNWLKILFMKRKHLFLYNNNWFYREIMLWTDPLKSFAN